MPPGDGRPTFAPARCSPDWWPSCGCARPGLSACTATRCSQVSSSGSERRAELDKAVGGGSGVVPVDLEDMVYAFEPLPASPLRPGPGAVRQDPGVGALRRRRAGGPARPAPAEGMRVLTYAMRKDRAEQRSIGRAAVSSARILACGGAAVRLVAPRRRSGGPRARSRSSTSLRAHRHRRGRRRQGGVQPQRRARRQAGDGTGSCRGSTPSTPSTATASWINAEPATSEPGSGSTDDHELRRRSRPAPDAGGLPGPHRVPAGRALLVGGGARLRGIASFLGEQLGSRVAADRRRRGRAGRTRLVQAATTPIDNAR